MRSCSTSHLCRHFVRMSPLRLLPIQGLRRCPKRRNARTARERARPQGARGQGQTSRKVVWQQMMTASHSALRFSLESANSRARLANVVPENSTSVTRRDASGCGHICIATTLTDIQSFQHSLTHSPCSWSFLQDKGIFCVP